MLVQVGVELAHAFELSFDVRVDAALRSHFLEGRSPEIRRRFQRQRRCVGFAVLNGFALHVTSSDIEMESRERPAIGRRLQPEAFSQM